MKDACTINSKPKSTQDRSGIRGFISSQTKRLRKGPLACPICKEVFYGLKELGKHIKDHCT
jgi:hypothetical protein